MRFDDGDVVREHVSEEGLCNLKFALFVVPIAVFASFFA